MKMDDLLACGIYVIINKKLKIVYVGQTQKSFLIRWIEHLQQIEEKTNDMYKTQLYLDKDTHFLVVKKLEKTNVLDFYKYESEAMDFYQSKGWLIVSTKTNRIKEGEVNVSKSIKRERDTLRRVVAFLGAAHVKENYVGRLLAGMYVKIEKEFSTDLQVRAKGENKSVLDILTAEEINYALLDFYPRYKAKRIAELKKFYGIRE